MLTLYGPLKAGRSREGGLVRYPFRRRFEVYNLCDKCRLRHAEARAAELGDVDRYAAWVREAPLIRELPDPLVRACETDVIAPGQGFVELVDVDYVAEQLARRAGRMGSALELAGQRDDPTAFRLPRSYRDAALTQTAPVGAP